MPLDRRHPGLQAADSIGVGLLRGPGDVTFDTTVQRRFPVTSRVAATLRRNVFNLFDRASFGNPNADITGANVGTITTLAGDPRVMQFSVRVQF